MSTTEFTLGTGTERTTGISSATVNSGAGSLGSEIDNTSNLDEAIDVEIVASHATGPTANSPYYIYVLYAMDGTNYQDGGASTQPAGRPAGVALVRNVTGSQRLVVAEPIQIKGKKYKLLVWNATNQNATGVTVKAFAHNKKGTTT